MAAMANITVKKNDGTTDIIYVAKVPSSGDNSAAVWKADSSAQPYAGQKPQLQVTARWNGPKTARRLSFLGTYVSTVINSTTGVAEVLGQVVLEGSIVMPQSIPQADIDEGVSQLLNLIGSATVKTAAKEGYAPT